MADEKKALATSSWMGRPILHEDHGHDLERRSAINEFHHKMPREQAEQSAHDDYVKEHRLKAAAHHLAGMKAAQAAGSHEDSKKHWMLYDTHLKALGLDSVGAVPPEIQKQMDNPDEKKVYKFKAHKGDLYALQEHKAEEPESMAKSEAKQCKWRLGERRCLRYVTSSYCHDHVDHWANKLKQKETSIESPMEKADPVFDSSHPAYKGLLELVRRRNALKEHLNNARDVTEKNIIGHNIGLLNVAIRHLHSGQSHHREMGVAPHMDRSLESPTVGPSPHRVQHDGPKKKDLPGSNSRGPTFTAEGKDAVKKADLPPSGTSHLVAPQLHSTVEGFMGGLKAIPKGSAERGKFITQHMNHGPFLTALQQHPQGKQVHAMLTQHLNGAQNAGFKAGATQVVAKSEANAFHRIWRMCKLVLKLEDLKE